MAKHKYKKRRENQLLREEQAKAEAMEIAKNEQASTKEPAKETVTTKPQKPTKEKSKKDIPTKEKAPANKSKEKAKAKQSPQKPTQNGKRKLSPTALTCIILAAIVVTLGIIAGIFYLTLPDVNPFTIKAVTGEEIGLA